MNAQEFKALNEQVVSTVENIEEILLTKIGEDFTNWVYITTIEFEFRKIAPMIRDIYLKKGWDVDMRNECENYHHVAYVDNVYLRYRCEE
jgi:hypothetical protein